MEVCATFQQDPAVSQTVPASPSSVLSVLQRPLCGSRARCVGWVLRAGVDWGLVAQTGLSGRVVVSQDLQDGVGEMVSGTGGASPVPGQILLSGGAVGST